MNYGYIRVSSLLQNTERQVEELLLHGLEKRYIFVDKQSGKDFERANYIALRAKLKKNDVLFVKSIDRLGRNYNLIIEEWFYITKIIEADIVVTDMPLLDTRTKASNLMGKFISDIVLQILSFVAETEREMLRTRQAEGIAIAKRKGIHMGRPRIKLNDAFWGALDLYLGGQVGITEASNLCNMKRSTFGKYAKLKIKEKTMIPK